MTKRADGWYKVSFDENDEPAIALYVDGTWMVIGSLVVLDETELEVKEMVMSIEGELVYHQHNKHDPLYNTKQEG